MANNNNNKQYEVLVVKYHLGNNTGVSGNRNPRNPKASWWHRKSRQPFTQTTQYMVCLTNVGLK